MILIFQNNWAYNKNVYFDPYICKMLQDVNVQKNYIYILHILFIKMTVLDVYGNTYFKATTNEHVKQIHLK